jgi:hypothetical protein
MVVAYVAVLFLGLLAPFKGYTRNDARWAPDGQGLEFVSAGVARSVTPPAKLHERLVATSRFSIELQARPADTRQEGPARIVSYSGSTASRNFTIGQRGDDLVVRLRTTGTKPDGSVPEVVVEGVFAVPGFRHVVVTYDGVDERVYVDGEPRTATSASRGTLVPWDPDEWLLVGNEHTATRPWRGTIRMLAIYDRVLAPHEVRRDHEGLGRDDPAPGAPGLVALYRFRPREGRVADESGVPPPVDLEIPAVVEPRSRPLVVKVPTLDDAVINLLIFVPLGLLASGALRRAGHPPLRTVAVTLALAAVVSLTAELLQHWIIPRSSELSDVVLNTTGAGLGAWLAARARSRA